jgi:hypothetical protein
MTPLNRRNFDNLQPKNDLLRLLRRVLLVRMAKIAHFPANSRWDRVDAALCLFLASVAAFALAAYPIYVIRPFREQKPAALEQALWVLLYDKPILVGLFCLIAIPAFCLWRRSGWVPRVVLVPTVFIALLAAVSTWFNPEEIMFHPFGTPRYLSVDQASLDPNDMVLVVTTAGESRAYPIREMGYHHVINDRLHQLPFVVTY